MRKSELPVSAVGDLNSVVVFPVSASQKCLQNCKATFVKNQLLTPDPSRRAGNGERAGAMRGAGMGSKWALFAVLSLVQLAAAAGVGTCALPGDCVIKNHPTEKSWDNGVAFLTAVGCEKKLTVVFGSLANSTGAPTVTVESRIPSDPQTTADQTSLVTGMALAERLVTCCAQHPIDKEELDASAGDGGAVCGSDIIGELSNFDCMTIKQTNVAGGYAVMEVGVSPRLYPWPLPPGRWEMTPARRTVDAIRALFLGKVAPGGGGREKWLLSGSQLRT